MMASADLAETIGENHPRRVYGRLRYELAVPEASRVWPDGRYESVHVEQHEDPCIRCMSNQQLECIE